MCEFEFKLTLPASLLVNRNRNQHVRTVFTFIFVENFIHLKDKGPWKLEMFSCQQILDNNLPTKECSAVQQPARAELSFPFGFLI